MILMSPAGVVLWGYHKRSSWLVLLRKAHMSRSAIPLIKTTLQEKRANLDLDIDLDATGGSGSLQQG